MILLLLAVGLGRAGDAPAVPEGVTWTAPRTPVIGPFPGTTGLRAADCGACHPEQYAEWRASTHAHAWTDRQYQAELAKDPEIAWLCINCHLPVSNQQPELTRFTGDLRHPERRPNPAEDPALREEGITCLGCHWRQEGIAVPDPEVSAPHPTVYDPGLRDPAFCQGCHQAVARLEDALVCSFNTGEERRRAGIERTCQDCHMPRVERPVAAGGQPRSSARHVFFGSGIPKAPRGPAEEAAWADWRPGVEASLDPPGSVAPGEELVVVGHYANARAGHALPTGDPERYLLVRLEILDPDGVVIGSAEARVGQRWEWWPKARKLDDNRLAPGESRDIRVRAVMPEGGARARLVVEHHRISPDNAAHHHLDGYPTFREVARVEVDVAPAGR